MTTYDIYRVAGDRQPPVLFTYKDTDLTSWDLKMIYVYRETKKKFEITATPIDLSNGEVMFEFLPGYLIEGIADLEFELTPPSTQLFTVPAKCSLRLVVRKELG